MENWFPAKVSVLGRLFRFWTACILDSSSELLIYRAFPTPYSVCIEVWSLSRSMLKVDTAFCCPSKREHTALTAAVWKSCCLNLSFVPFPPYIVSSLISVLIIAAIKKPNNNQKWWTNGSSPGEKRKREPSGWHPEGDPNCGFSSSAGWRSSWTQFCQ